jgi:hypothetical protein
MIVEIASVVFLLMVGGFLGHREAKRNLSEWQSRLPEDLRYVVEDAFKKYPMKKATF